MKKTIIIILTAISLNLSAQKKDIFGAGTDWLIIGYENEPLIQKVKAFLEPEKNNQP